MSIEATSDLKKEIKNNPKIIRAWTMYDWANSVYNLVITSTIFPTYFLAITGDGNDNTKVDTVNFLGRTFVNSSLYSYVLATAFLTVALMSPILSSIADYKGNKKSFLRFFCTLGSLSCASLFFFTKDSLLVGVIFCILACIGYWSSLVFYNSYLPEITTEDTTDKVSAKGFTMGYIGSVILQIICFIIILASPEEKRGLMSRICFILVGIWWLGFAQYTLSILPKGFAATSKRINHSLLTNGFIELGHVLKQIKKLPKLLVYLVSFFFFNMAVQTVMLVATAYGAEELAIDQIYLMPAILIIQLVAIGGAFLMANLSSKIGNVQALMVCILIWICICIFGYFIPAKNIILFYSLAFFVGIVMGGTQSLSRSTYSKLMPETKDTTSFFSFYDVTEKLSIVAGMFSFGYITEFTGSQRNSVLALVLFFIVGLISLFVTLKTKSSK